MDWRVKGVVQKVLSHVPFGVAGNDLLQRTIGARRKLADEFAAKVNCDWTVVLDYMTELGISPAGLDYLEIGTGWYPTFPLCFALAGAKSCTTFDQTRHLDARHALRLLDALPTHLATIAKASHRSLAEVRAEYQKLRQARGIDELLRDARIDYRAPGDGANTGLPDKSVDIVYSNSVLEHIPTDVIRRIMRESMRVLRPGGVAIHGVNCGDHYAYFDRSITPINYLSYSERHWAVWNNGIQYQNRLRPQDILEIAENAGLEIILKRHEAKPQLLEKLEKMTIAPEFRKYSNEQLACTSVDFVARKRREANVAAAE
ncbi:MAG: methyltransferase domain-containing protein [Polyangiaceae bacterium]